MIMADTPYAREDAAPATAPCRLGNLAGQVVVAPNFDEPLSADITEAFGAAA